MNVPIIRQCGFNGCQEWTPYLLVGWTNRDESHTYRPAAPICPPCMQHTINNLVIMDAQGNSFNPLALYANHLIQSARAKHDMGGA